MTTGAVRGQGFLIAGGSGSIGAALGAALTAAGARVALHGRRAERVDAVATGLADRHPGAAIVPLVADLTLPGAAAQLVEEARAALGRLDGVANAVVQAPPGITGPLATADPSAFTPLLHDSVTQVQWLLQAAAPRLAEQGGGAFVTIVSDAALYPAPNQSLIAASRAGIAAFCRNAALELATAGVRVNCVSTSFVADSRIAADLAASGSPRLARAAARAGLGLPTCADVAALCLFLLGPGAARLTGQVISVNGGLNA